MDKYKVCIYGVHNGAAIEATWRNCHIVNAQRGGFRKGLKQILQTFFNFRNKNFVDRVLHGIQDSTGWKKWQNTKQSWPPQCTNRLQWPHEQSQAKISVQLDKTRSWERCLQIDFQLSLRIFNGSARAKKTITFVTWYGDIIADRLFQVHLERGQSSACLHCPPPSASRRSQPGQNLAGSFMTLNRVTNVWWWVVLTGNRPLPPPRERSSWTSHPRSPEH